MEFEKFKGVMMAWLDQYNIEDAYAVIENELEKIYHLLNEKKYIFPVRAIKGILRKELDASKDVFVKNSYPNFILTDVQKEFIYIAHNYLSEKLEKCTTYKELEEYLTTCGYRMSLQEWISSLH